MMQGSVEGFTKMSNCMFDNKCVPKYPDDGKCISNPYTDGLKNLTTVDVLEGKWWVTKGLNPHFDSIPCQHADIFYDSKQKTWVNNVTWLNTMKPKPDIIGTQCPVYMEPNQPGVFVNGYPAINQTEPWIVVSMPHPDWAMVLWCGDNPVLKYAGAILLSRASKNYHDIPKWVDDIIREAVAKHGLDFDKDLFVNDNSKCEENPNPWEKL